MYFVSLAVIQNKFEMTSEKTTGGLGTKRVPGRPKKRSSALKKD